jgi:hypothetical protein
MIANAAIGLKYRRNSAHFIGELSLTPLFRTSKPV